MRLLRTRIRQIKEENYQFIREEEKIPKGKEKEICKQNCKS